MSYTVQIKEVYDNAGGYIEADTREVADLVEAVELVRDRSGVIRDELGNEILMTRKVLGRVSYWANGDEIAVDESDDAETIARAIS